MIAFFRRQSRSYLHNSTHFLTQSLNYFLHSLEIQRQKLFNLAEYIELLIYTLYKNYLAASSIWKLSNWHMYHTKINTISFSFALSSNNCRTSIVDFHKSCPSCSYDLCPYCYYEIREGLLPGGYGKQSPQFVEGGLGYLHGGNPEFNNQVRSLTENQNVGTISSDDTPKNHCIKQIQNAEKPHSHKVIETRILSAQ